MSVHLRKDGAWVVSYREEGKARTKYFGRGDEALQAARKFDSGHRQWVRRTPKLGGITFGELAALYVESAPARMEVSTINVLVSRLNGRVLPLLSAEPAASLTAQRLDAYLGARMRQTYRGEHPHPATVKRELHDILAILNWGVTHNHLSVYPATGFKKPTPPQSAMQPPTQDEVRRLIAAASDRTKRLVCLIWYCGMRPGREVLRLKWSAVDWERKTIYITSAKKHGPKSRVVALHPDLYKMLKKWRKADTSEYIISYCGRPIVNVYDGWRKAIAKAGLAGRGLTPYSLRHAFATHSLLETGNLRAVSSILGHANTKITAEIYTATYAAIERDVVERMPSVIHR